MELQRTNLPGIIIPADFKQNVDLRDKKIVNSIKQQGRCDCCWAMVAVLVAESVRKVEFEEEALKQLSPQMLIDCVCQDPPPSKVRKKEIGCYTYSVIKTFEWLKKNPVQGEDDYPYKETKGDCLPKEMPIESLKIKGYVTRNGSERDEILRAVARHPVAASINITREFKSLSGEIYEGPAYKRKTDEGKHAVAIIGYGTDEESGKNYWLIQNSWGEEWGVDGVGKVNRDMMVDGKYLLKRIYPYFKDKPSAEKASTSQVPV